MTARADRVAALIMLAGAIAGCGWVQESRLTVGAVGQPSADGVPRDGLYRALDAACGVSRITEAGASYFARQPYVQDVTSSSAAIVWTAGRPATVVVSDANGVERARVTAAVDPSARLPAARQYVARLDGLEPGAIHCYRIEADGQVLVTASGLRTAPATAASRARFIATGDLGKANLDQLMLVQQMFDFAADFAVIPGDVIYDTGTQSELERHVFAVYQRVMRHLPFYVAAGNHDYQTRRGAPLREAFVLPRTGGEAADERWYSFDWGPVHVVVLDSVHLGATQQAWLRSDLAASRDAPWRVVVLHHPPRSSGWHGDSKRVAHLMPIMVEHQVDLVIAGHDHHYERLGPIDGVTYVVAGGGGRGTRRTGKSPATRVAARVSHFVYVDATSDRLRLYAIDATGLELDSAIIER